MSNQIISQNFENISLTQNPENFSDDAWELILNSEDLAQRWRHSELDVEHLIQVLFGDNSYRIFVEKLPINQSELLDRIEFILAELPVSRGDQIFIGENLETLFDIADQYKVSFHEIVALNSIKDPSIIKINQKLLIPRNLGNNVPKVNKILVVSGYGSGHGVGMSQWGAKYMATKGAKAEEILKHFYKGVKIKPFKRYFL